MDKLLRLSVAFSALIYTGYAQNDVTDTVEFPPVQTGSQCFHVQGIPTLQLRCPGGELIRVQQSFFGVPPSNKTCAYTEGQHHCVQLTEMSENCMGRYMCSVYVSNPFLSICRTYATYMQVNYTCVQKAQIYDMCEDHTVTTHHGYLSTPNYPDANYTANQYCRCRLQTQDKSVFLQLLDFSINHTERGKCNSDYLKITDWGNKCGYINPRRLPESLTLHRQEVFLEFRSDAKHQARGMWLEFNGSQGGKVKLTCTTERNRQVDDDIEAPIEDNIRDIDPFSEIDDSDEQYLDTKDTMIIEDDVTDNNDVISKQVPGMYPQNEDDGVWRPWQRADATATTFSIKEKGNDKTGNENEVDSKADVEPSDEYDLSGEDSNGLQYSQVDEVQIITGVVVGVLILIAVIIIIVLVFRR